MDFLEIFRKQEPVSKQQLKTNQRKPTKGKKNAEPNIKPNVKADKKVVPPKTPAKKKDTGNDFRKILVDYESFITKITQKHNEAIENKYKLLFDVAKVKSCFFDLVDKYEHDKKVLSQNISESKDAHTKQAQIHEDTRITFVKEYNLLRTQSIDKLTKAELITRESDTNRDQQLLELRETWSKAEIDYQKRDKERDQELVELREKLYNAELHYQKKDEEGEKELVELRKKLLKNEAKIVQLEAKITDATSSICAPPRAPTRTSAKKKKIHKWC